MSLEFFLHSQSCVSFRPNFGQGHISKRVVNNIQCWPKKPALRDSGMEEALGCEHQSGNGFRNKFWQFCKMKWWEKSRLISWLHIIPLLRYLIPRIVGYPRFRLCDYISNSYVSRKSLSYLECILIPSSLQCAKSIYIVQRAASSTVEGMREASRYNAVCRL